MLPANGSNSRKAVAIVGTHVDTACQTMRQVSEGGCTCQNVCWQCLSEHCNDNQKEVVKSEVDRDFKNMAMIVKRDRGHRACQSIMMMPIMNVRVATMVGGSLHFLKRLSE